MRDMTKSANPDLARSCTDLVLLTLLQQEPMYGYQILTTLQDRGNGEFRFKQGTLYPVLYRMEREGWIEAVHAAADVHDLVDADLMGALEGRAHIVSHGRVVEVTVGVALGVDVHWIV